MRRQFIVELEMPQGALVEDARSYILDAVQSWCGSLFPGDEEYVGDPMWPLEQDSITVTPIRKHRKPKT